MVSKVEIALEQEIAEMRAILDATPEARKLAKLIQMLELYRGLGNVSAAIARELAAGEMAEAVGTRTFGRARSPERQAVIDAVKEYLRSQPTDTFDRPLPVRTSVIYKHLQKIGVPVPGTSPQNNLSAMLSNDPDFKSNGRNGWTLAENENPVDAESRAEAASTGLNDDLASGLVEPPAQGGEARPGGGT